METEQTYTVTLRYIVGVIDVPPDHPDLMSILADNAMHRITAAGGIEPGDIDGFELIDTKPAYPAEVEAKPKDSIIVIVDGGIVQDVFAGNGEREYTVIDYDTEGGDDSRLERFTVGGQEIEAYIYTSKAQPVSSLEPEIAAQIAEEIR